MDSSGEKEAGSIESNLEFRLFVSLVKEMLLRPEYLFPYVWAQRQYRSDSYQAASASQLGDLFFDTFGTYLSQESLGKTWDRRVGKEKGDFQFENTGISHKEGLKPIVTAFWTAGQGDGYRTPRQPTWNFEHAITFTYTPLNVRMKAIFVDSGTVHKIKIRHLNHKTIEACTQESLICLGHFDAHSLWITQTWTCQQWSEFTIHDVRRILAPHSLLDFDFWILDSANDAQRIIQESLGELELKIPEIPLLPGIYFLEKHLLQGVHLTSNNRAHVVSSEDLIRAMSRSVESGSFVRLPLWPAIYADMRPASLYAIRRRQFDDMLAPRE